MRFRVSSGIQLGEFQELSDINGIVHCVSTRSGGTSERPFDSLNLGLHVPDSPSNVIENRNRLCCALGISLDALVVPEQVHGSMVKIVRRDNCGAGSRDENSAIPSTDALVTRDTGVALMSFSSDCPLILLYDQQHSAIGLVHAGWRGTIAQIARKTVRVMSESFGSAPAEMIACICPSIGPCCFEVKDDVIKAAQEAELSVDELATERDGRTFFDLWLANERQLIDAGLKQQNIHRSGICTACRTDLFFSHRKAKGPTGRFAAVLMLKS